MNEIFIDKKNKDLSNDEEIKESHIKKYGSRTRDIYYSSNILSKLFFYWAYKIIKLANYMSLEIHHLGNLEGPNLSKNYSNDLEKVWEQKNYKIIKNNALLKASLRANCCQLFLGFFLNIMYTFLEFTLVYLLRVLIQMYQHNYEPPLEYLKKYFTKINISVLFVSLKIIQSFLSKHTAMFLNLLGNKATAELNCLIYKKVLKLSSSSLKEKSKEGEIINYLQIDSEKLSLVFVSCAWLFVNPIQLIFYMYMLFEYMGLSFIVGLGVLMLIIIVNSYLMKMSQNLTSLYMKKKDERMKITTETIYNLKVLKLYGWDHEFLKKINKARDSELHNLRHNFNVFIPINSIFFFAPTLISMCSIGAYQYFYNYLKIEDIFTCLNIFNQISIPLIMFPSICLALIELFVSMKRVETFLREDDVNHSQVIRDDIETIDQGISIKFINGFYSWGKKQNNNITNSEIFENSLSKSSQINTNIINSTVLNGSYSSNGKQISTEDIVLKNLNLDIYKGEFICIIGNIGSGKSSLLQVILNNMIQIQEENLEKQKLIVNGTISLVSQTPWIQNDTIRNNILLFSEFDEKKYNHVLDLCELRHDLYSFPGGDMTEIGERGVNLSGGQKARISIARAVYSNNDILLFDDPISALDNHVGESIIKNVILHELKNKTRLLVTHALQFITYADRIIYMENGEIEWVGKYNEIYKQKFSFDLQNIKIKTSEASLEEVHGNSSTLTYDSLKPTYSKSNAISLNSNISSLRHSECNIESIEETFETHDIIKRSINEKHIIKRITKDEKMEKGEIKLEIFYKYFKYIGGICLFFLFLSFTFFWAFLKACSDIWLTYWTKMQDPDNNMIYFYIYSGFVLCSGIFIFVRNFILTRCSLRLSKKIHEEMIEKLIEAPINLYHDTTPIGQIINRLSSNLNTLDNVTSFRMNILSSNFLNFIMSIAVCSIIEIYSLIFLPILMILGYIVYKFYANINSDISRLESISKTPIINLLSETLRGNETIRAFGNSKIFCENFHKKIDDNYKVHIFLNGTSQFYYLILSLLSTTFLIFNFVLSISYEKFYTPEKIGIILTYSLIIQSSLNIVLSTMTSFENSIISMERCLQLTTINGEFPRFLVGDDMLKESKWPHLGKIEFLNYSVKYRPETDLVLKNLNFKIEAGEKIGVVGRTGSGKSTICLAIFRILEAYEGKILIDDMDISKIGLYTLRSNLAIIPQDPNLMQGTLKFNIDPWNIYTEQEIKSVMNMIGWKICKNDQNFLHKFISENGNNLSNGEKQLICITRAILRVTYNI